MGNLKKNIKSRRALRGNVINIDEIAGTFSPREKKKLLSGEGFIILMKRIFLILVGTLAYISLYAQFTTGTTGLLNMPTAEMQRDKTFMFGGGFLERHATPARWTYNTLNYYINITLFPWLEVAYDCTLHKAMECDPAYGCGF